LQRRRGKSHIETIELKENFMPIVRTLIALAILLPICSVSLFADKSGQSNQSRTFPEADPSAVRTAVDADVEIVADGLNFPTSVELDDQGNVWIGLSGAGHGNPGAKPAVLKKTGDEKVETVIEDGLVAPLNDLLWHDGTLFISHRGKVSKWNGSMLEDVVSGLPSKGDHTNNQIDIGPDGKLYIGQGSATNSGVVGPDNKKWVKKHPNFHDTLPRDVALRGETFSSKSIFDSSEDKTTTSAFMAYGETRDGKQLAEAVEVPTACLLRCDLDGSNMEVFAWGLRNPYGVHVNADGTVLVGDQGCDVRGSRPVKDDLEDLYLLDRGDWAGWPDYCYGIAVTDPRFKPDGKSQPKFLMAEHPDVAVPIATFPSHSAIGKLDRLEEDSPLGKAGDIFVALFGNMAPKTGDAPNPPGGMRLMRFRPSTGEVAVFAEANEATPTDWTAGIRRPLDVRITPDAQSLLVADYGALGRGKHLKAVKSSGVVWKITAK
jgi:glucose/arabinose dehydrogenase